MRNYRILTADWRIQEFDRRVKAGGTVSFQELADVLGGWNEVYDAILDDGLPTPELREAAQRAVSSYRGDLQTRALLRLEQALLRMNRAAD